MLSSIFPILQRLFRDVSIISLPTIYIYIYHNSNETHYPPYIWIWHRIQEDEHWFFTKNQVTQEYRLITSCHIFWYHTFSNSEDTPGERFHYLSNVIEVRQMQKSRFESRMLALNHEKLCHFNKLMGIQFIPLMQICTRLWWWWSYHWGLHRFETSSFFSHEVVTNNYYIFMQMIWEKSM